MKLLFFFICIVVLFFSVVIQFAQTPAEQQISRYRSDSHYQIRHLGDGIVELRSPDGRFRRSFDITDQKIDPADLANDQVIDLIHADTTLYNWKYKRQTYFPVGSIYGYPIVIGDFNRNGKIDIAGTYKIAGASLADCAILELNTDTTYSSTIYVDSVETVLSETDVDQDGLTEINFRRGQLFDNYESTHPDSFPDSLMFSHRMWEMSASVSGETFKDLDNDGITDVLYTGDDSLSPWGQKIYVAEYDTTVGHFVQRFRWPPPHWDVYLFSNGDFDQDGFIEFVTGSIKGDVYVCENTGNDSYSFIFSDTIHAPNAYLTCATNDIDNNGKPEFFVGGSAYYMGTAASRVYWFEADGNNHYQKIRTVFLLGTDVLGNTVLYNYDADNDGKDELVFCFSGVVVILKWNPAGYFDLFYVDWWENRDQEIHGVNLYPLFGNSLPNLLIAVTDPINRPRIKSYIYSPEFITAISDPPDVTPADFQLYPNYPNPFNSSTTIRFGISRSEPVTLVIYDITGKEVIRLLEEKKYAPGEYAVSWNGRDDTGKEVSSGIYMTVLTSGKMKQARKMVVLR